MASPENGLRYRTESVGKSISRTSSNNKSITDQNPVATVIADDAIKPKSEANINIKGSSQDLHVPGNLSVLGGTSRIPNHESSKRLSSEMAPPENTTLNTPNEVALAFTPIPGPPTDYPIVAKNPATNAEMEPSPKASSKAFTKSNENQIALKSVAGAMVISEPILNEEAAKSMSPFAKTSQHQMQRSLPDDLKTEISQFQMVGFAQKFFSTQRQGIFRRIVPIEKMLIYQKVLLFNKDPISAPILNLPKQFHKDAVKCFRMVQKVLSSTEDIMALHHIIAELLERGIRAGPLRDEIYCQVIKVY